jgi:DNA helicase-2/ATP-dependent DNA helicase PcrA
MASDENVSNFTPVGIVPTPEQVEIQTCRNRSIIVMASAGAAKTTTLALRIAESIARNFSPSSIIALTFSKEAATVLKDRLLVLGLNRVQASAVTIETFEEFAKRVLREHIEYSSPSYAETAEAVAQYVRKAVDNIRQRNELRSTPQEIWLPESNEQIADALRLIRRIKGRFILPRIPEEETSESYEERHNIDHAILTLYREIERTRFDPNGECYWRQNFDAIFDLAQYLDAIPKTQDQLPPYRVIMVDELQDMNPATAYCLDKLIACSRERYQGKAYFTGVGDFDQVIHHWSGADIGFIRQHYIESLATKLRLSKTFRHGAAMTYATGAQKNKTITTGREVRSEITLLKYAKGNKIEAAGRVIEAIKRWHKEGHPLKECAIILRNPHQSVYVENALLEAGIGWRLQGLVSYLTRPEILMLRGLIAYALDDYESIPSSQQRFDVLKSLVFWQELGWSENRVEYLKDYEITAQRYVTFFDESFFKPQTRGDRKASLLSEEEEGEQALERMEWLAELKRQGRHEEANALVQLREQQAEEDKIIEDSPVRRNARERLKLAVDVLKTALVEQSAEEVISQVIDCLDIRRVARRLFIDPMTAQNAVHSMKGFVAAARQQGGSVREFAVWLRQAEEHAAKLRTSQTVLMTTIDSAKGNEYPHVIMPFLENDDFPLRNADVEEERNRFYVAITRMRDALSLVVPAETERVSTFVKDMKIDKAILHEERIQKGL